MNVNEKAYPSNYHVSANINNEILSIDFSDSFFTLDANGNVPLGSVMDNSNCYCGFNPAINNLYDTAINQYCIESINPDNVYEFSSEIKHYRNTVNYRLCLNVGNRGGNQITRYTNLITNQDYFQPLNVYQNQYYVCSNSMASYSTNFGISNYIYPITNIDLDKIVLYPEFLVIDITPIYTDDIITSYQSSSYATYTYNQIKPTDNTDAGENFDTDLWTRGFKDTYENGKLIKRTIVAKCYLRAYFGTNRRNVITYVDFKQSYWNADGNRQLPTSFDTYHSITPIIEIYDDLTGSVIYKTIPYFADRNTNLTCESSYQVAQTGATALYINSGGNTLTNYANNQADSLLVDNRIDSKENSFKWISNLRTEKESFNIQENSSTAHYIFFFENTGEIMHTYRAGTTFVFRTRAYACYPLKDIVTAIASLGLFVAGDSTTAYNVDISDLDNLPETMYHGNIDKNGITDGTLIQGTGIKDLPTYEDIEYSPVNPDSGGGGGDDDTEEEGDRISPQFRQIGTASNFITQYGMTAEQVALFGKLLWTSWADSEGASTGFWKNFFLTLSPNQDTGSYSLSDVIQFIVSLRVYPFSLTNLYYVTSSGSQNVFIGRGEEGLACGGGINLLSIGSAVDYIQCGSVTVPKTFNDFRDYENTAITAYLPYCGTVELSPGDVIGKTLNCHYAIDMQSGQCTAFITSSDDSGVLYPVAQKDGEIGFMIPLTATNSGQLASQKIQDAKNIAETIGGVFWNNVTAGARMIGSGTSQGSMIAGVANGIYGTIENVVGGLSDLAQQSIDRLNRSAIDCPSLSGGTGFASFGTPATAYIQIRHGIYKQPENYAHTQGRVTTKSGTLSSFSGFTKCINPDLSGLSCTVAEKSEIKKLLESGVYI